MNNTSYNNTSYNSQPNSLSASDDSNEHSVPTPYHEYLDSLDHAHTTTSKTSQLNDLNPQQIEAVEHKVGPILILAGAGSGKTRVLTRRIAHLVLEHKERPDSILAVTFTNKAAHEMKERVRTLLGEQADRVWLSTFHSSAVRILRRHADLVGFPNNFAIYDAQDSQSLMKRLLKDLRIDTKKHPHSEFLRFIDRAKNSYKTPDDLNRDVTNGFQNHNYEYKLSCEVYEKYQRELKKADAMDFSDLLMFQLKLFADHPNILRSYQESFKFVLVDEFQDTNDIQYKIVKALSAIHKNILVVGDDDQSIYSFRGATIENILNFEHDFKDTKVIRLEQNYRSTKNILTASHAVIEKTKGRKKKQLWTNKAGGDKIKTYVAEDETDEAYFIANEINKLKLNDIKLSDIAVFYRTNAQSRALEEAFIRQKIAFKIFGGLKFYDRKEVKDILAYLRVLVLPSDSEALLRIINTPTRGIGQQSINTITDFALQENISIWRSAKELSVRSNPVAKFITLIEELTEFSKNHFLGEIIAEIIKKSGYKDYLTVSNDPTSQSRLENLKELQGMHRAGGLGVEAIREFLERVSLTASADLPSGSNGEDKSLDFSTEESSLLPIQNNTASSGTIKGSVTLMTLHLAKGLEFPVVFLTGFEEGLMPHYRSTQDQEIDEERRLCYVGMTRAKETLYISRARRRSLFTNGDSWARPRPASRFGVDLPDEVLESLGGDIKGYGFDEEGFEENFSEDTDLFSTGLVNTASSSLNTKKTRPFGTGSFGAGSFGSVSFDYSEREEPATTFQKREKTKPDNSNSFDRLKLKFKNQDDILNYLGVKKAEEMKRLISSQVPNKPYKEDTPNQSYPLLQLSDVSIDKRVNHPSFGAGIITAIESLEDEITEDCKLTIQFDSEKHKKKRLVFKHAKLGESH